MPWIAIVAAMVFYLVIETISFSSLEQQIKELKKDVQQIRSELTQRE